MKTILLALSAFILTHGAISQNALSTIKEFKKVFKTYGFSDPNPIANPGAIYPYYRFDGYTDTPVNKEWKVVELENEFIRLWVLPEIGGKIWAAWDKASGKSFIYYNQVVKFRDVSMRGPWTSGGIEANYGIMGHTPNCATPMDYITEKKEDGSVSCTIGTLDLLTQTYWSLEINLPKDKAYFTTRSFWYNSTPIEQPYYSWMNAGIKAAGNLEFVYPGNRYLGHNGEYEDWKINKENGKEISFYDQNNFGGYKSYHVFGQYTDFFGGYWHNENFGMARYSAHDEKAGKKIWIWGLSQQGMIWEKLLSDTDGQYVEVQSGRLFNQSSDGSTFTPFKHRGFSPAVSDSWTEYWFPVKNTKGFVQANQYGALNVRVEKGLLKLDFSPVQDLTAELKVRDGNKEIFSKSVNFKTLKAFADSIAFQGNGNNLTVTLGETLMKHSSNPEATILHRPVDTPQDFDWNSLQGLYLQGKENIRERYYPKAEENLTAVLIKDPNFLPALSDMSMLMFRKMEFSKSLNFARQALSIDTYDPAGNFYYGLANAALGNTIDAKDGFDIASISGEYRSAAFLELSKIYMREHDYIRAAEYANKSLVVNSENIDAHQILALLDRLTDQKVQAKERLQTLSNINRLNHFIGFEEYRWANSETAKSQFTNLIQNEMPQETYLELADWYLSLGLANESLEVLKCAPPNAEIYYWMAYLNKQLNLDGANELIKKANDISPDLIFPFRTTSAKVLEWVRLQTPDWKPKYYLGLIHWGKNNLTQAKYMFSQCEPDYAPFYASRAALFNSDNYANDIRKAAQIDPNQWRYGKLLINHLIEKKNYEVALTTAQQYHAKFPRDFRISMLLANTLLMNKQYAACIDLLAKTKILPYEGATDGRQLHHESWMMVAVGQIQSKEYKNALNSVNMARQWPENLGAGRPYGADIDARLENYVEGICFESSKDAGQASRRWNEIIAYKANGNNVNTLISALALRKSKRGDEGEKLLSDWVQKDPDNKMAKWCLDVYHGNKPAEEPKGNGNYRIINALLVK